jgi:hypothetical protein
LLALERKVSARVVQYSERGDGFVDGVITSGYQQSAQQGMVEQIGVVIRNAPL